MIRSITLLVGFVLIAISVTEHASAQVRLSYSIVGPPVAAVWMAQALLTLAWTVKVPVRVPASATGASSASAAAVRASARDDLMTIGISIDR